MVVLRTTLLVAVSAVANVADAQKKATAADPYRAVIEDAIAEFDAGNYAEARVLFAKAHGLKPSARTLRGMGMTSFELREYVRAEEELNASLVDLRQPLAEAQRKEVLGLLLRLERYIGKLEVRTEPDNATVTLDGAKVSGRFKIELGRHELNVRAPGYRSVTRTVIVEGGKTQVIEVALTPGEGADDTVAAAAAGAVTAGSPQTEAPAPAPLSDDAAKQANPYVVERDTVFETWWFWGVVGIVVAGGVTAAVVLSSTERTEPPQPGRTGSVIQVLSWAP